MKLSAIRKQHKDAGAMHQLIGPCAFVGADGVILTKLGDLMLVLRVDGIDPECLEPQHLEYVARRFEAAIRNLGPEYRVYEYFVKRDSPDMSNHCAAEELDEIGQRRAEWLESRAGDMYSAEIYFVVLRERGRQVKARGLLSGFSRAETLAIEQRELDLQADQLRNKVHGLVIQLRDTIGAEILDREEATRFLRQLVNYSPYKADAPFSSHDLHLDQQVALSSLTCWKDHLELDDYFVHALTMREPPAQTMPHLLKGLLRIPCKFILCSEWKREDNGAMRKEIQKQRRHHHLLKSSFLNYLGKEQPHPEEMLIDDSRSALVAELGACLQEIEVNGNAFGRFSMTVLLYGLDPATVKRAIAECFKTFSTHDAVVIEERYNLLNAWLACIPGNYAHNLRYLWLLNTSHADLSFLFAPSCGERHNRHLDQPALAVVETEEAGPYFLNLHYQDVGHTCVLGSTGSGKSFLLNFLIGSLQQYRPFTVIFDLGGSYRKLTQLYRGSYLRVGVENRAFTINPFCLEPSAENLHFLFSFVRVLIESAGYKMTGEDAKDLDRALGDFYQVEPGIRRLSTLARTLRRDLERQLHPWIGQGRYAPVFDNVADNLALANFQTFDFEGMDNYPDLLEPLLFYILHRANAGIYNAQGAANFKVFVMDEAWRFFKNATTRAYILEALKTWRKRNAAMILATQSSDDLVHSEIFAAITESCMTKMFLANPGMDAAAYRETFKLNATEAAMIARLIPKQQFLLKRPDLAKVLNLHVDAASLEVYESKFSPEISV